MSLDTNNDKNTEKSDILGFSKRHYTLMGFLIFIIAIIGWWQYAFPSATWRYKMTVIVETPEGLKTGSTIRDISMSYGPTIGDIPSTSVNIKGEAVVVDLGKRGLLFGTLGNQFAYDLTFRAFPYSKGGLTKEGMQYYDHLKDVKASLLEKNYLPSFVTFKNPNDPMTVQPVDIQNLEKSFGQGVKIKDVTVEMTDESIAWKIQNYLPWLENIKSNIDGTSVTTSGSLANRLDVGQFKRGTE